MAFKSISDTAWPLTDDGPLASVCSVRMAGNAAAVSDERPPAVGIVYPSTEPHRACSFFEAAIGPYFIWIPEHEFWESVRVRVRIGAVELDGATTGTDAAYLTATIGTATGAAYLQMPPVSSGDWILLQSDDSTNTLPGGIDDTTITVPLEGARGWVPVFVWIKSIKRATEIAGTDLRYVQPINGSISVSALPSGVKSAALSPPEWMIEILPQRVPTDQTSLVFSADQYQVCYHYDPGSGDSDWFYLMPPPARDYAVNEIISQGGGGSETVLGAEVNVYPIGVVPILSIAIDAVPMAFEPREEAFYSKRPAAEQWKQLAEGVDRIVLNRPRQWACWPGPDSYSPGEHARPWPLRADDEWGYSGGAALDVNWRTLVAVDVVDAPPDDVGYEGIVSLGFNQRPRVFHPDVEIRIAIISGGLVVAEGETYTQDQIRVIAREHWAAFRAADYQPIHHTIAGSWWSDEWQTRGGLYWSDPRIGAGSHDWERVLSRTLPIVESDGLTYPIKVVIQAKLSAASDPEAITCLVVGGAIRSADID